jgi:uncharacterized protein with LGFP repeats
LPLLDPIQLKYQSLGGQGGFLGKPTSPEQNTPYGGGRYELFQHGAIYWLAKTGAHDFFGAIESEYQATASEHDAYGTVVQRIIGLPTADETNVPSVAGARVTHFQGGTIYRSTGTGAHVIYGAIGAEYQATASEHDFYGRVVQSLIGLPTSDEAKVPGQPTRRVSTFQHGAIYWTPATGAHEVHGLIAARFAVLGWEGAVGEAVTDEIDISNFTYTGAYNRFQQQVPFLFGHLTIRSAIDSTPGGGATLVHGPEYSDIVQGDHGTCWIDASIGELEDRGVDLSQDIQYQGNNWYTVSLYNFNDASTRPAGGMHADTQWVYFDGTTYGADLQWNSSDPAQSWALIVQRAVI